MRLRLEWLRTLQEVLRAGSFTRAAHALHLTQPAVSQHVRELERAFGRSLVERVGRRAAPTRAAEILLAHAEHVFAELEAAEHALGALEGEVAGRVRLGSGATASIHLLPPALRRLRERHPELELIVATGNTPDIVRDLVESRLDLALVTLPVPGILLVDPVYRDRLVVAAPPAHRLAGRARIEACDLADEPLILYPAGSGIRVVIDDWLHRAGVSPPTIMEIASAEAIKKLVGAGLGLSVLSEVAVRAEAARGELAARPTRPAAARRLALVRRRDKPLGPALAEVEAAIRGELRGRDG